MPCFRILSTYKTNKGKVCLLYNLVGLFKLQYIHKQKKDKNKKKKQRIFFSCLHTKLETIGISKITKVIFFS